uniref:F-box domain-containing protein n=1 Tax=Oryza glumipatula TaxID=40148 RepID=A0A0E0AHY3_9ORYZ
MELEYYVLNAATRSISRLPPCQTVPSGSAGLCFDARTGEYKVVRLFREKISGEPHTKCQATCCHLILLCDRRDIQIGQVTALSVIGHWSIASMSTEHVARDLMKPDFIRVIGSANSSGMSGKKNVIIATSNCKAIAYDPTSETLETILEIKGAPLRYQTTRSALGLISLFEDSLAPVCKTNEEIALSSPLAKVIKEALLRLPGDYPVQFKLVSKQWHRFIESGGFVRGYDMYNNRDRRPKIRLVGKGTGGSSGFSFANIEKLLQESPSKDTWLDAKVVCSKPCHGMNLISTELEDYLYNPCTGYRYVRGTRGALVYIPNRIPSDRFRHDHAFTTGNKNVGLRFDPLMQEHVIVELFYQWRNFKTCRYNITCSLFTCKSRHTHDFLQPPLPDGRILLNTGKKLGLYDPTKRVIENLYDLDEVLRVKQTDETLHVKDKEKTWQIQVHDGSQLKCQHSVRKFRIWLSPLEHDRFSYYEAAPASSRKNSACSNDTEIMPFVPILYEDSLASYPLAIKPRYYRIWFDFDKVMYVTNIVTGKLDSTKIFRSFPNAMFEIWY